MEDDDSSSASNDLMPHLHDRGYRRAPSPVAIRGLSAPVNQPRTPRSRKHASSGDLDPSAVKWSARKQSLRETSIFVESATSTLSASDKRLDEQRAQAFRLQAELNIEAEKLHKESFMIAEERGQLFQRERALEVRAAELQAMQAEALLMQRKGADAFAAASVESQKISLREQVSALRRGALLCSCPLTAMLLFAGASAAYGFIVTQRARV